jgi:hypothetical protein
MNRKLIALAKRRELLVAQAAQHRIALMQAAEPWRAPLAFVDRGIAVVRDIARHPTWLIGASILLITLRPWRSGSWLRYALVTWRIMHGLGPLRSQGTTSRAIISAQGLE